MENQAADKERFFSIELKSKANLRNVAISNGSRDNVLVEGTLGELVQATFAEEIILEVVGKKGILRIDLGEDDIKRTMQKDQAEVKNR